MLVQETPDIRKFISERADPHLLERMSKAEMEGDTKTYNRLVQELIRDYEELQGHYE